MAVWLSAVTSWQSLNRYTALLPGLWRGHPPGPGTAKFSISAGKTFQLSERFGLGYEAQFANLFNILNRDAPT